MHPFKFIPAIVLSSFLAVTLNADLVENFDYNEGFSITGGNGGTGWASAWSAPSPANGDFVSTSQQAIYMGNSSDQLVVRMSRAFSTTFTIDEADTLTLTFDLIVNETQTGRGIGLGLTDSSTGNSVFIGKEINGEYGVHGDIQIGGDTYAAVTGTGSKAITTIFTYDGTNTQVSVSDGASTNTGMITGQFSFDGMDLTGYHMSTMTNGVDDISLTFTSIPEPGSAILLSLIGGAALFRRRRS